MPRRIAQQAHTLGSRTRRLREAAELTQSALASKVNTDAGHIARIERGAIASPRLAKLEQIARVLGGSVATLLGEDEKSEPVIAAVLNTTELDDEQKRAVVAIIREMTRKR